MTLAKKACKDYRIPLLAVLIFVIMSLVNKNFFTPYNIFTIADSISGYGIVALGFTFILLVGQLDISFGSVIALSACIFMMMLQAEMNFLLALLAAIAVGCACGAVTGFFVATFRLSPFIVSMTMPAGVQGHRPDHHEPDPGLRAAPRAAGDQQYQAVQHFPDRVFLLPAAGGPDGAVSAQYAVRPQPVPRGRQHLRCG